ncbi:sulfite exporter TauE/SafE family protein [Candidatus Chlorohelix sp.]|uniref:sulfite exporter TauE/SafE family protein n=1 Tax=Candidatus Chlorohelix sp. TaxID=3139201 RepID=UPI0030208DA7
MLLELFIIGLFTGYLSGLFGVGGGFILVPLLTITGIPIKTAIALSLVYIIGTALSGIFQHLKQNTADIVLAATLSLSSIITAQLGTAVTVGISTSLLKLLFGLLTASVAIFYSVQKTPKPSQPSDSPQKIDLAKSSNRLLLLRFKTVAGFEYKYRINLLIALIIGGAVGFLSGMFGVGGGFIMVPLMVVVLGVPLKIAVGTSLLAVLAPAISGSFALWRVGQLQLELLPALLGGGLIGAQIGARMVIIFKNRTLKTAFNILLFIVSCYMLTVGIGIL